MEGTTRTFSTENSAFGVNRKCIWAAAKDKPRKGKRSHVFKGSECPDRELGISWQVMESPRCICSTTGRNDSICLLHHYSGGGDRTCPVSEGVAAGRKTGGRESGPGEQRQYGGGRTEIIVLSSLIPNLREFK